MIATVAYASISEKGTVNGAAGNQSGKELKIADYYDFGQNEYFRFYKSDDAWWMADIMERLCRNKKIGYSQADRTSLYKLLKENGWKSGKVDKKCNCDCSSLITCAVNCIDEKVILKSDTYTGNLMDRLKKSGYGSVHKITKGYKPMAGDIICKAGKHVICCIYGVR